MSRVQYSLTLQGKEFLSETRVLSKASHDGLSDTPAPAIKQYNGRPLRDNTPTPPIPRLRPAKSDIPPNFSLNALAIPAPITRSVLTLEKVSDLVSNIGFPAFIYTRVLGSTDKLRTC
jgi:hypothetical protein